MPGVTFTRHAVARMRERGIAVPEMIWVLRFGEPVPTRDLGVYKSRISASRRAGTSPQDHGDGDVTVVFNKGDSSDQITVITAYRRQSVTRDTLR